MQLYHDNETGKTPFQLGQEAYLFNKEFDDNPYSRNDGFHDLWREGWAAERYDHICARKAIIEQEYRHHG